MKLDIDGGSIFLTACWWLWCGRNKLCFANEIVSSYTLKLIIVNYVNLLDKYFLKHDLSHPMRTIMWNAHKYSNIILNVDGSSLDNPDVLNFGGLIRNVDGVWIHNFANNINYFNIFHAELIKLYHDLSHPMIITTLRTVIFFGVKF